MYRSLFPMPALPADHTPLRKPFESTKNCSSSSTIYPSSSMPPLDTTITTPRKTIMDYTPRFSRSLSESSMELEAFLHDHRTTPAEKTTLKLRDTKRRFAKGVPLGGDDKCHGLDRQIVLSIYNEALNTLIELPEKHTQIAAECTRKVRVVLGLIFAEPDDTVFTASGQLLKPLEPSYADPRLKADVDTYGHLAQWRLNSWRKEGWPGKYPTAAVQNEKKGWQRLVDENGRLSMSVEKMFRIFMEDDEMWDDDGAGFGGNRKEMKKGSEQAEERGEEGSTVPDRSSSRVKDGEIEAMDLEDEDNWS